MLISVEGLRVEPGNCCVFV